MVLMTSHKKFLAMVLLGNVLETYDYALYGSFAVVLAQVFFPSLDPTSALLASFTVFAVGFIARPLGAAIFGYYGDKYGRKKMLMVSIMIMASATGVIGLLPSYDQIGMTAGLLLAVCRLLQGFAVGAEFVGTMIYMVEQAPANRKTFFGSLCICSGYLAMLGTAVIIGLITNFIAQAQVASWGWRIPFLLGVGLGLIGLYIRSQLPETPTFKRLLEHKATVVNPLVQVIVQMPWTLLLGAGVVMLHVLGFYLLFIYMTSYLNIHYGISAPIISLITTMVTILAILLIPIIGILAEKFNHKYFIVISTVGLILFAYPLFRFMDNGSFFNILFAHSMLTILIGLTSAVLPAFLAELFPPTLRFSGMAICYNMSAVIFGGTAPLVLTFLVDKTHDVSAPGLYLVVAATVTLFSTLLINNKIVYHKSRIGADYPPIFNSSQ